MRGNTELARCFCRRQPVWQMPQIQKTFDVWIHTSSSNSHFFAAELIDQIIHKYRKLD